MIAEKLCPWLLEAFALLDQASSERRLAHAWLITGPEGVGKLNLVYAFANRMLCGEPGSAPPESASARDIAELYARLAAEPGSDHPDLYRVHAEEGKRTIAVDQIREMTRSMGLTPHVAGLKIVVIESAERMTIEAANALLKTLEEPTPNTYLLLTCSRPGRLPATIRSRCQQLQLRPPNREQTLKWLGGSAPDGVEELPSEALVRGPVLLACELAQSGNINKYNGIYKDIDLLYEGKADPHEVADRWQKGDLEAALSCLVDRLQQTIRARFLAEPSNRVTDSNDELADNQPHGPPSERSLFGYLESAESLRDQFGRGTNMELALKVLLLGLAPVNGGQSK